MSRASTELYEARETVSNALRFMAPTDVVTMLEFAVDFMSKEELETMLKMVGLDLTDAYYMAAR